eukprot:scaffold428_cov168-Ochromonas_danica.AAC.7
MDDLKSSTSTSFGDRYRSPGGVGGVSSSSVGNYTSLHERLTTSQIASYTPSGNTPQPTLKEEYEERQRLERQNFDLKLRVFHLEETIKKLQDTEVRHEVNQGMVRSEVSDLKLQLEEKSIEVEQRDLLLMKAKSAIEAMKSELERCKQEIEKQSDLEERIKRLRQMNDEIELDYKNQLYKLDAELASSRQMVGYKEQEKSMLEEKLRQAEVAMANLQDSVQKGGTEKTVLEDRWLQLQQRVVTLEDDLTQAHAHIDLYKMQIEESQQETDQVKDQLREALIRRKDLEESQKQRIQDITAQFEAQIRTIRNNHEQDLEKMRSGHAQMLNDIRENYQSELSKARNNMERSLEDRKTLESIDIQRVREECQNRLNEKNSELKTLHALIESDRMKYDNLMSDLESCRTELREKTVLLDHLRSDLTSKSDELQVMSNLRMEVRDSQRKNMELQDQLRAELLEKTQLSLKLEQTTDLLEASRQTVKELEAEIHLSKVEVSRLTHTTSELGNKADGIEFIARDNEKLRIVNNKLQQDLLEANHKIFAVNKDLQHLEEETRRFQDLTRRAKEEIASLRAEVVEKKESLESQLVKLQQERDHRLATENTLQEQKAANATLKQEIDQLKEKLKRGEYESEVEKEDLAGKIHILLQASAMARRSLVDYDEALSTLLEGEAAMRNKTSYNSTSVTSSPAALVKRSIQERDRLQQSSEMAWQTQNIEEVRQETAVLIERVTMKIERAIKIRYLFDQQVDKVTNRFEALFQQVQERSALLSHRLEESERESVRLHQTLSRDRESSRRELEEVKKLREVLLSDHASALRDHEERYTQLLIKHEQEKSQHEQMKRHAEKLVEDIKQLELESNRKVKDYEIALDQAEAVLSSMDNKMNNLMQSNALLQGELQNKDNHIHHLQKQNLLFQNEINVLILEGEKLALQLQSKVDNLHEAEDRIQRLLIEVDRLRTRQIDPELAKILQESHEKQRQQGGGGPGENLGGSTATTTTAAAGLRLSELQEVEVGLRSLIRKSDLMLSRAENFFLSLTSDQPALLVNQTGFTVLRDEVRLLLEENHSLLHRIQDMLGLRSSGVGLFPIGSSVKTKRSSLENDDMVSLPSYEGLKTPVSAARSNLNGRLASVSTPASKSAALEGSTIRKHAVSSDDVISESKAEGNSYDFARDTAGSGRRLRRLGDSVRKLAQKVDNYEDGDSF